MVRIAIRKDVREFRVAKFSHYGDEAHKLMTDLARRNVPACMYWSDEYNVLILGLTKQYQEEVKRGYEKYPQYK